MIKDAQRIGIWGASGSGKSTLAKVLCAKAGRVVVFDPMDEYRGLGFRRCETFREVAGYIKQNWRGRFRIAYVPPEHREAAALHRLAHLLRQIQQPYYEGKPIPKLTLVVEEMNTGYPVRDLPAELSGFPGLCSRGRHYGIEIIGISQRIAEVNTRFRGNTNVAYFFAQGDHRDTTTITQMIGPEHRAALHALQRHEYLRRGEDRAVVKGRNSLIANDNARPARGRRRAAQK